MLCGPSGAICALSWVILVDEFFYNILPYFARHPKCILTPPPHPPPPKKKTPRIYTVLKNDPGGHKKHGKSRIRGKFSSLLLYLSKPRSMLTARFDIPTVKQVVYVESEIKLYLWWIATYDIFNTIKLNNILYACK